MGTEVVQANQLAHSDPSQLLVVGVNMARLQLANFGRSLLRLLRQVGSPLPVRDPDCVWSLVDSHRRYLGDFTVYLCYVSSSSFLICLFCLPCLNKYLCAVSQLKRGIKRWLIMVNKGS
jgi:hypothetical protein